MNNENYNTMDGDSTMNDIEKRAVKKIGDWYIYKIKGNQYGEFQAYNKKLDRKSYYNFSNQKKAEAFAFKKTHPELIKQELIRKKNKKMQDTIDKHIIKISDLHKRIIKLNLMKVEIKED